MRRVWWLTTILAAVAAVGVVQTVPAGNAQEMRVVANSRCPPGVPPILPSTRLDRVPLGEPRFAQGLEGQMIRPEVFEMTCIAPAGELVADARSRRIETRVPGVARELLEVDTEFRLGSVRFPDLAPAFPQGGRIAVPLAEPEADAASGIGRSPSLP